MEFHHRGALVANHRQRLQLLEGTAVTAQTDHFAGYHSQVTLLRLASSAYGQG